MKTSFSLALLAAAFFLTPFARAAELHASDGLGVDDFGSSASLSGTLGLVGSYQDDDHGANSGSAYLFRNLDTATDSIPQIAKLTAFDGAAGDGFGYAAQLVGTVGLVGAAGDDSSKGSAYLFLNLDGVRAASPRAPSSPPPTARMATASVAP